MTFWTVILAAAFVITLATALMAIANLQAYERPMRAAAEHAAPDGGPLVSICVPARNEESNLEACVDSLRASRGVSFEILVYDDHSTDGTATILERLTRADPRVRAVPTAPLPSGWNGKQFGCQSMGEAARGAWLLFTDADVRFEPDAVALALDVATSRRVDLLSTFPRQETGSLLERLIVPLIHFILLSYLPFRIMRAGRVPSACAGCGQFLLVSAEAWRAGGGHAAFRASMHDGIRLPRAIRASGGRTDLFDATELVRCRMYRGFRACWSGFAKNAYEGVGSLALLVFFTLLHAIGHVAPWVWLAWAGLAREFRGVDLALAAAAIAAALAERALLAVRFRQSWLGVVLHPVAMVLMTAIQWHSFVLALLGRRAWRGRRAGPLRAAARSGML